jgi:hypothetical protein
MDAETKLPRHPLPHIGQQKLPSRHGGYSRSQSAMAKRASKVNRAMADPFALLFSTSPSTHSLFHSDIPPIHSARFTSAGEDLRRDAAAGLGLQEVGGILLLSLEGIQIVVVSLMAIRGGPHRNRQCSSVRVACRNRVYRCEWLAGTANTTRRWRECRPACALSYCRHSRSLRFLDERAASHTARQQGSPVVSAPRRSSRDANAHGIGAMRLRGEGGSCHRQHGAPQMLSTKLS